MATTNSRSPAQEAHMNLDQVIATDVQTANALYIILQALLPNAGRPITQTVKDALKRLNDTLGM